MDKKKHSEDEFLEELAPRLFEKRIEVKPKAPEGYFTNLEEQIRSKIESEPVAPKGKVISLINFKNLAVAASVAVLLALVPYFFFNQPDQNTALVEDTTALEDEDLDAYIDEASILEWAAEEDVDMEWGSELDEDAVLAYLIDVNIEEDLIIEETEI